MRCVITYLTLSLVILGSYGCSSKKRAGNLENTSNLLVFHERYPDNQGEIESIIIELDRWSWNRDIEFGQDMIAGTHYSFSGTIPEGLTFRVHVLDRKRIELIFEGSAVNHHVNDSMDGLSFQLFTKAFLNSSEKALQEEITTYDIRIQFGVGYPLVLSLGNTSGKVQLEILSTGEQVTFDPMNSITNDVQSNTLFESGETYEVQVSEHPEYTCCYVVNGRGVVDKSAVEGIVVQCEGGVWTHPQNYSDYLSNHFNNYSGELELISSNANQYGDVATITKPFAQGKLFIMEFMPSFQEYLYPNLSSNDFRTSMISDEATHVTSSLNDRGFLSTGWIKEDGNGDDQVHIALTNRNTGVLLEEKATNTISSKSNLLVFTAKNNHSYFVWIENTTTIHYAYFDGKKLGSIETLWNYGVSISDIKGDINNNGQLVLGWITNGSYDQLYHALILDGEIETTSGINQPISFDDSDVTLFDVTSSTRYQGLVWTQEDPSFSGQYNIYYVEYDKGLWQTPTDSDDYLNVQSSEITVLHLRTGGTKAFLMWGYQSGTNDYKLKSLNWNDYPWDNLFTIASISINDTPHVQSSMNRHGDILVTWTDSNDKEVFRRIRKDGNWGSISDTGTFSLDSHYFDRHVSKLADNGIAHIAYEGKKDDKYRLYVATGTDTYWNDPEQDEFINPEGSYYTFNGGENHFYLSTGKSCGSGHLVWEEVSENTGLGINNGKQIYVSEFQ